LTTRSKSLLGFHDAEAFLNHIEEADNTAFDWAWLLPYGPLRRHKPARELIEIILVHARVGQVVGVFRRGD
jgi:hypothetical protein